MLVFTTWGRRKISIQIDRCDQCRAVGESKKSCLPHLCAFTSSTDVTTIFACGSRLIRGGSRQTRASRDAEWWQRVANVREARFSKRWTHFTEGCHTAASKNVVVGKLGSRHCPTTKHCGRGGASGSPYLGQLAGVGGVAGRAIAGRRCRPHLPDIALHRIGRRHRRRLCT